MILKHKDRDLLRFDWIKPFGVCHVELNRKEIKYLPIEFRHKLARGKMRDLVWCVEEWLMRRTAPMNRHFVRDILISSGFNPNDPSYLRRLLEFCKGLSLNDVHWIVPDDFKGKWRDCNLYRNDFPKSVAALAFSGMGNIRANDISTSPEYTTNGVLAKCWRRDNSGITLWKAGSEKGHGLEPYAEFYAAQIASALGVNHVPYRLASYKNRVCSVCPIFTTEQIGFIPVGKLFTREEIVSDKRFADIFLLDAVLLNDDRHLGNFGFLVNNDTNEITDVAPAFDHGHSFFARPKERFAEAIPSFYENWLAFPGFNRADALERLFKLQSFRLKKDTRFNLPKPTFQAAVDFLSWRINCLISKLSTTTLGGPVKVENTGPGNLLSIIRQNPGLRTNALSRLAEITPRTTKRYLAQLKPRILFKGAPKTGGYYVTPTGVTKGKRAIAFEKRH